LKHLLSISFLYFSGTTQALATYVNIGTIKHLIIKIFPKIVKFLFVHKSNKLLFSQNLDNITVNKYAKQIPEFYGEVLRSWNKIGGGQTRTPLNFADIRKQIIWGNKLIKSDHKTLLFIL
jgi:hypothetical protein